MKHSLYNTLVTPRPIGWISSISADGVANLAPYSFFNSISGEPPCVMYCANGPHLEGGAKDSLQNVVDTGEFVFNLCTADLKEQMNATSASVPRSVDEMAEAGLEPMPSKMVRPPRVGASPLHLECELVQVVELPSTDAVLNRMVIGRVVHLHIAERVITDGMVDWAKLSPTGPAGLPRLRRARRALHDGSDPIDRPRKVGSRPRKIDILASGW